MSTIFDLKAELRETLGSGESRRMRKSGQIPAIIYDNGNNINISVPTREFEKEYFKGNILTTLISLDVKGKAHQAVINKIDLDPVSDRPNHIIFIKTNPSKKTKAKVKVKFLNADKSPGIKKGGFLHITARKVELLCPTNAIPNEIEIDLSKIRVGDKIVSSAVNLPENVTFVKKSAFNIASIIGRGSKETPEDKAAAEAAATAEAAKEADKK